jgi:glutamate dehydrogenase
MADIARASVVARDVFNVRSLWADVESLDGAVPADTQYDMLLSSRRMVERSTRWLLRTRPRPLDIAAERERYGEGTKVVAGLLPGVLVEHEQENWRERVGRLTDAGVPEALAGRVAAQGALFSALDVVDIANATEHGVEEVAALHFEIGGNLHLHWLRDKIALLSRDTRWAAMARAALRDDLFSLHAELTTDVLRAGGVDAWSSGKQAAVERAQEILNEIRSGGTFDLTTLPVALREVRNLIGRG